jgi:hypothetical protein
MRGKAQQAMRRGVRRSSLGFGFMGAALMVFAFGGLLSNDAALAGVIKPAVLLLGTVGSLFLWCGGIDLWFQGMSNHRSDTTPGADGDEMSKG